MTSATHDRAVVQLSLRTLFKIVLGAAVVCAIAAPWVRALQPVRQAKLAVLVAIVLAAAGLVLLDLGYHRRRMERTAGPLLLKLSVRHRGWSDWFWLLFFGMWIASWVAQLPEILAQPWDEFWAPAPTFMVCIAVCYIVAVWWGLDPTTIEVRQNGLIVVGRRFVRWEDIQSHRWGGPSPSHLTLQLDRSVINLRVAPRGKRQLDQLLKSPPGMRVFE